MFERFRRLTILGALIIVLAGCGGPDGQRNGVSFEGGDAEPVEGDWLIMSHAVEPDGLNRIIATNAVSSYIWAGALGSFVGEYLLTYDTDTWRLDQPLLAEAYPEISPDNLTYTFTIRDGVRWHDGEPFSAADVLFSIKATMLPSVDSAALRGYFADLVDVQVEGRRIRFQMSRPYFMNDIVLGNYLVILPKHVFDPDGVLDGYSYGDIIAEGSRSDETLRQFGQSFNRHPANRAPIGTGPYRFVSWDSGSQIVLERNDEYWGKSPYLERIVIRFILEPTAELAALKAGETDFYSRMTPIQWARQTSGGVFDSQFAKSTYSIPLYYYIAWNPERPFFSDKRVRQAMTMLVPRQQIIETLRFGLAEIAVGPFSPQSPDYNPNIEPWPYDPERATALLEEVGWIDHDGDGIRDKDGVPFSFEYAGSAGSQFTDQLLPILRDEFQKVGIEMTERRLEFTVLVENTRDKQYDSTGMAWVSDLQSDPYQLWHSNSIANRGSNYVSFRNAEADRLIEEARVEFDPDRRRELYGRFQEIIHEEQPYTFLFYTEESAAYNRRFRNVRFLPVPPGYDLTEWFVPLGFQRYSSAIPQ